MTIGNVTRGRNNGKDVFIAQVSYTDENGRRRFIRGVGMTERQAMQRRQANIAKRLASPPVRDSAPALTVCDVFTRWIDSYGPNDISTEVRRKHRRQGELHILPFLADVPIADLDRERAQRFLSHDSAALPDGAWRNTYKVVKTMLTWATNTDLIPRNPITGVKQRTYKAAVHDDDIQLIDKRTTIALDLLRWLKDEQHKHYVLILFMFLGLRRSELLGLTWKCIDDDDEEVGARIHVRQQLARAKGQGWFIDPRTKNNKSRIVYMPHEWWVDLTWHKMTTYPEIGDWRDDLVFRRDDWHAHQLHRRAENLGRRARCVLRCPRDETRKMAPALQPPPDRIDDVPRRPELAIRAGTPRPFRCDDDVVLHAFLRTGEEGRDHSVRRRAREGRLATTREDQRGTSRQRMIVVKKSCFVSAKVAFRS
jgi:integrase